MSPSVHCKLLVLCVLCASSGYTDRARAQNVEPSADVEALARITSSSSELRAGPGLSYRVVHRAQRGETFAIQGREAIGYWVRVYLKDGRTAYLMGDTADTLLLDEVGGESRVPGVLSPPLLEDSWGGVMMSGGMFGGSGFAEWRPAFLLSEALALEPYVGLILTGAGRNLLYGGAASLNLAPDWAIAPYVSLGGGGYASLPSDDAFAVQSERLFHARAGGGLLVSLRWRISLRLEASHTTLFDASTYRVAQSFVAGFGSYF